MMPGPVEISQEIRIQSQKDKHMTTVRDYIDKYCDKKGMIRDSENLTAIEREGRSQIENGIENKGWCLYQTDKSEKICLDTIHNY